MDRSGTLHAGWCWLHSPKLLRWTLTGSSPVRWPGSGPPLPRDQHLEKSQPCSESSDSQFGTQNLLMDLALDRVEVMPFPAQDVAHHKDGMVAAQHQRGLSLQRLVGDRDELPIDFRFLDLLLRGSGDPEVHLDTFAQRVKVGLGTRMPRLPSLYKRKRRWRLPEQRDPLNYLEDERQSEKPWRQTHASDTCWSGRPGGCGPGRPSLERTGPAVCGG